jgi:hypothetical protein
MNPFFTRLLVALYPIPLHLFHTKSTILIVGVIFVAFYAENILAIDAIFHILDLAGT